jgi:hypothetical protein
MPLQARRPAYFIQNVTSVPVHVGTRREKHDAKRNMYSSTM